MKKQVIIRGDRSGVFFGTLEITYRDSIPIDSVVVFKDEFKK